MKVYAVYSWQVKRGQSRTFVKAWVRFSRWITKKNGSTGKSRLFRELSNQTHFMSVDSWDDREALESLQASSEFERELKKLGRLLDGLSYWPLELQAEEHLPVRGNR